MSLYPSCLALTDSFRAPIPVVKDWQSQCGHNTILFLRDSKDRSSGNVLPEGLKIKLKRMRTVKA